MKNDYEIRGDVTVIFLKRKDGSSLETIIDTQDLNRVKEFPYTFYARWGKEIRSFYADGDFYISRDGKRTNKNTILLHRWIFNLLGVDDVIDHKNNNTLDNRKSNLRVTTTALNAQNRKGPNINNKSGYQGVSWHKASNKWRAFLRVNYKQKQLGVFDNIEDAIKCVSEARKIYMPNSKEALAN